MTHCKRNAYKIVNGVTTSIDGKVTLRVDAHEGCGNNKTGTNVGDTTKTRTDFRVMSAEGDRIICLFATEEYSTPDDAPRGFFEWSERLTNWLPRGDSSNAIPAGLKLVGGNAVSVVLWDRESNALAGIPFRKLRR